MDQVTSHLAALDTITGDFKSCLESTERAVSSILTNTKRTTPLQSSPSHPPQRGKNLRKILHLSHKRFKRLIIAQHQEIVKLRKTLASPKKTTVAHPSNNAPTPSSSSMLSTPKTISNNATKTTPPTTPVSKSVKKQQQSQTLRKRVLDLLKRHRTLSSRLTGNKSQDSSTLAELRSITAQLLDLGIKVPLTGPRKIPNNVPAAPTTTSASDKKPSSTTTQKEEDEDTKHFEYLFAKIMSGPVPTPKKDTMNELNESLTSAVQQQLFVSTPSPGRRRAKIIRPNKTTKPLLPPSSHSIQTSSLQSMSTPPRNTSHNKLSPRNPTPGSRKRARIATRGDDDGDVSSSSFDGDLMKNANFYVPSSQQQSEQQLSETFVPSALHFSSPSSSFESTTEQGNNKKQVSNEKKSGHRNEKEQQNSSNHNNQCSEGHTPPRLFVRTPPHRNATRRKTGHLIHPPTISSSPALEQQQQQQQKPQPKNSNDYTTQQQHHLEEILEDAMVGSPFPPMSPILEPVDRSAIFAPDDIMSDLHVVKTLNMIGGNNNGPMVQSRRISSSPPVNGLMSRKHHHHHQQHQSRTHRSTPCIPFVDARPRAHRALSSTLGANNDRDGGGSIPFVRRIRSPKLNNKINLRSSIRLARQSIKK